jgi:hypothetical protein
VRDLDIITAGTQETNIHPPGTDDNNEWQGDDLFEGATQTNHNTLAIKEPKEDQSVDTVLDQEVVDQSFETIHSDDPPNQHKNSPGFKFTNRTPLAKLSKHPHHRMQPEIPESNSH